MQETTNDALNGLKNTKVNSSNLLRKSISQFADFVLKEILQNKGFWKRKEIDNLRR